MNELKLISQTTPAVVTFNYAEIDAQLEEVLKKYTGLLFTDETVSECKKTMAELKKGKKSLNDFKINTKKLLTEDILKFEEQCKLLSDKFDTVINPIGKQAENFEVKRKEEKRLAIQTLIENLGEELEDKYYEQLVITDSMLNKGTTMKSIIADITKQAEVLLSQQNIEKANFELIKSKVELANSQYGVTLPVSIYLRMLEYKEITEITGLIASDAEKTKIAAEKAEAERVAIEQRKAERLAIMEVERVAAEKRKAEKAKVISTTPEIQPIKPVKIVTNSEDETVIPSDITSPKAEIYSDIYTVSGTEEQLDALDDFLISNNYEWSIKED
ncbi:MAG: DUF1351 domain-containing protein [Clostridium sp.]|uniref:DUF1351 domain-containing protein n=1 Tax=Clostridium sp. TaxID=1506 RepID=UPI00306298A5